MAKKAQDAPAGSQQPPGIFRRIWTGIKRFFFPPPGSSRFQRILPYAVLGIVTFFVIVGGSYAWDYSNSPVFCGTTCHTMPPEYAAYQVSPHARVDCVECHIGRDFLATRFTRKVGDLRHVALTIFQSYEYPIYAGSLRPARETCERCHYPSKFSDDSLRQIVRFEEDEANTRISIYLAMRTGGGSAREGLGRGIHWHVENEVWFVALDDLEQEIPYVRVVEADGTEREYVALDSPVPAEELTGMEQVRMDCITCHNRITHSVPPPDQAVDQAMARHQISADIPFIRREAAEALGAEYASDEEAEAAIRGLADFYAEDYPDFYRENQGLVDQAVTVLLGIYADTVFRDQEMDWQTHPNNIGHENWPGCFRCHDGQHVEYGGHEVIRLECNMCHSIPQVVGPGVIEPMLPLGTGLQPDTHFSTHWINRHHLELDDSCSACHNTERPGAADNSSFCSNSACHGTTWQFAQLDAPGLAEFIDQDELLSGAHAQPEPVGPGGPTWDGQISLLFADRCVACHSATLATAGLVLESYDSAMRGGNSGPVILPGDAEGSLLVVKQSSQHYANFSDEELELIIEWITGGAPEY